VIFFYLNKKNLHLIGWKKNFRKTWKICWNTYYHAAAIKQLSSFWLVISKQQWTIKEISIFSTLLQTPSWMKGGAVRDNFERGSHKDNPSQIWFHHGSVVSG
jgi:hypothetical protein